jgi:hypothetical protein
MCRKEGGLRQERKRGERMREYIFKSAIHFMHHTTFSAQCNATTDFFPLSPFVPSFLWSIPSHAVPSYHHGEFFRAPFVFLRVVHEFGGGL